MMALADEIRALRAQVSDELAAAQDYFAHTAGVWDLVARLSAGPTPPAIINPDTGEVVDPAEVPALAQRYVAGQLTEDTFQKFFSIFEAFAFDLLSLWLNAYPQSLGRKTIEFRTVLDLNDLSLIRDAVVRKEVVQVLFESPADWFAYMNERMRIGVPAADEIARFAEAKASRDVLVHNKGVAGPEYLRKSGTLARYRDGERIELPTPYHRETWQLLGKIAADICDSLLAKLPA